MTRTRPGKLPDKPEYEPEHAPVSVFSAVPAHPAPRASTLLMRQQQRETIALFRYQVVRRAADPALTTRQRGRMVRGLVQQAHPWPFGGARQYSRETLGAAPSESTLLRHFRANNITRGAKPVGIGRFEADYANEIWGGDAQHGPKIGGRKTYLFAFVEDYS